MPKSKKITRNELAFEEKQSKLNVFIDVKQKSLTPTAQKVLELSMDGQYPAQIARALGLTRAGVSYHAKQLEKSGYIMPRKKGLNLTKTRTGGLGLPYDVRWRALLWSLSKNVKLPHDDKKRGGEWTASGVKHYVWHFKSSVIELVLGKGKKSLIIAYPFVEGGTRDECNNEHDERCRRMYAYLSAKFPEVAEASKPSQYRLMREGELNVRYLGPLAKKLYEQYGRIKTDVLKEDKSLGIPELQLLQDAIMSKKDLEALNTKIDTQTQALVRIAENQHEELNVLKRISEFFEKLLGSEPKEPSPKPLNKNDDGMYR